MIIFVINQKTNHYTEIFTHNPVGYNECKDLEVTGWNENLINRYSVVSSGLLHSC